MEVRLTRNPINAIAEQDEEYDDDDVPQNEMDGPKKGRIIDLEGNTVEVRPVPLSATIFLHPKCLCSVSSI